jgi:hypothetical protein
MPRSFPRFALLRARCFFGLPAGTLDSFLAGRATDALSRGLAALSLWDNSLVPASLAATPTICVAPLQGCRCWPRCGDGRLIASAFGWDKNTKGFALSFPKPELDTPVWRALPAGPRQGIDSGFPSPSHPRRKAGRMSHVECGFAEKEMG